MKRGDIYDVRLDPTEGREQQGTRPAIVVSRDSINATQTVVIIVPCTTYRGKRLYPSHVRLTAPDGGLATDSVALAEQVRTIAHERLGNRRGMLSADAMAQVEQALIIAMDLRTEH